MLYDILKTAQELKKLNISLDDPNQILLAIIGAAAFIKASQSLVVTYRTHQEQARQDRTFYDPGTHMRWDLRRKPTNYERSEILRRRKMDEDIYDILVDLGLSK